MKPQGKLSTKHLRDEFEDKRVFVLAIMALWKRGSHVSESLRCRIIVTKDVECLIGFRHEKLGFVKQAATIDYSIGVSVDQFVDDMFGVSKYHYLPEFFSV